MSFKKKKKNGHITLRAEAKSTADLEMKVTPSESREDKIKLPTMLPILVILIYKNVIHLPPSA